MKKNLKIYLASPRGFCAGVKRAIEIVEKSLNKYGKPVYVRVETQTRLYLLLTIIAYATCPFCPTCLLAVAVPIICYWMSKLFRPLELSNRSKLSQLTSVCTGHPSFTIRDCTNSSIDPPEASKPVTPLFWTFQSAIDIRHSPSILYGMMYAVHQA